MQGQKTGTLRLIGIAASMVAASLPAAAFGEEPEDDRIAADGTIRLDGVNVPLSQFTSPEGRAYLRHLILNKPFGTPLPDIEAERVRQDEIMHGFLKPMRERYAVAVAEEEIGGIVTDVVTPAEGISPENADRVLINLHGGGFVTGGRSASLVESVPLAALMKIKVVSVDYRMAPEHAFPAASEDVAAVYRELLKQYEPSRIGIYGCSAGGLLTAQSIAWFRANDLPNPAAVGVFCASLSGYFGGESTVLSGPLTGNLPRLSDSVAAPPAGDDSPGYLDAASTDDPLAYPLASREVVADFPPTLFITGTRSFEFSSALNSHNRLASAGVESRFHGWEGMFHGFIYNSELRESRAAYDIMADFFQTHLAE
ncbi:acetyl esterase/lipase [Altererythrobacter atlanticus]|uniref:Acetyl esterase n=1 Tax=Croceibacterium atlanticum TaxID=1267766 RepID=A0A0F7KRN1_9SPHN|nr:alpha/beta hydrolase fold domain-containing protein [Croceibacterium atlanticum]AKH41405.1 Acetyl esterase [Croceibacterium atlanticum]MBB5732867.1 acetyl esterase/lipase [Croceibacterium atlanticum]